MIDLDLETCRHIRVSYDKCYEVDTSHPERFTVNGKRQYTSPFDVYTSDYAQLIEQGLTIVNPSDVGYPKKRTGVCHDLVMHLLGKEEMDWRRFYASLQRYPRLESPTERSIILYTKSKGRQGCINHLGLFLGGRPISKFGCGPIFRHGIHQIPFFDENEKVAHKVHFLRVDS